MTVLEQIRLENPNLALVPDDELIEQLLDSYTGDLDPDQFVESLTKETPVESPVESPTIAGKRPIGTATDPSDIGFGEAFTSGLKSNWQRTWGPVLLTFVVGLQVLWVMRKELHNFTNKLLNKMLIYKLEHLT